MKKCYNIKTWEDITDRTMISLAEDCIFVVHKDGSIDDTEYPEFIERKLSTFEMIERMIENDDACYNSVIKQSTPNDPILAKLCELTGAKMYGDYIIINNRYYMTHSESGDLFYGDIVLVGFGGHPIPYYSYDLRVIGGEYPLQDFRHFIEKKVGNIFEEYSKFLRQEENKWEEVKELINL